MLDYSGNLLWGFDKWDAQTSWKISSASHVTQLTSLTSSGSVVCGTMPLSLYRSDIKLHIQAWLHHFAAIFGWDTSSRQGIFSPECTYNHPDTLFEFVKALKECGYRWLLVQEHSVETLVNLEYKHLPHRLVARNSQGETLSITALIKTQGSDTKLVGQMQPYYEHYIAAEPG